MNSALMRPEGRNRREAVSRWVNFFASEYLATLHYLLYYLAKVKYNKVVLKRGGFYEVERSENTKALETK